MSRFSWNIMGLFVNGYHKQSRFFFVSLIAVNRARCPRRGQNMIVARILPQSHETLLCDSRTLRENHRTEPDANHQLVLKEQLL
jgi:hypothetical protein